MRVRVKVCGTTSVPDALLAAEAGADAIGLIFAPVSKRLVGVEVAREVSLAVGPAVGRVGVFMGQGVEDILRTAEAARVSAVQVHGDLPGDGWARLLGAFPVLRVLKPGDALPPPHPNLTLMFDAPAPGSGQPLDWAALAPDFPHGAWLAGGLGPENVRAAMEALSPAGVDAVSRLEQRPGVKDRDRVRAFVHAVVCKD